MHALMHVNIHIRTYVCTDVHVSHWMWPETVTQKSLQLMADCRKQFTEGKRSFVFYNSLTYSSGRLIEASHS